MHYSAKRGLAIACRLSVRLSVCDVGGSWPHRLKILETNCVCKQLAQRLRSYSPKVIHLFPGEHGEILGRKCSFNTYVHNNNIRLNWVNRQSRDLRWVCGCLLAFVGALRGHLCDNTAFFLPTLRYGSAEYFAFMCLSFCLSVCLSIYRKSILFWHSS